jgi:hypothetical protein
MNILPFRTNRPLQGMLLWLVLRSPPSPDRAGGG